MRVASNMRGGEDPDVEEPSVRQVEEHGGAERQQSSSLPQERRNHQQVEEESAVRKPVHASLLGEESTDQRVVVSFGELLSHGLAR